MTPVIVALVSEGLNRPARVIGTVRQTRATGRYDPVAEGRAGLREGDLERARGPMPAAAVAERRVHRASGRDRSGFSLRLPKPRMIAAIATGLVAFLIAAVFLTSSELVLGKSVTSSSKRTTLVPVHRSTSTTKTTDTTDTTPSDTTTTPTIDTTTTPPAESTPPPSETTPTVPGAQQTAPATPQTTTTAPPASPTPAPQTTAPAAPTTTTP
jgi:cytoskeletal protein RodZ